MESGANHIMQLDAIKNIMIWAVALVGSYSLIQLGIVLWLWFFHDKRLLEIRNKLHSIPIEVNESNRGRGVMQVIQERQIEASQRPLKAELELREYKRKSFLDRAH